MEKKIFFFLSIVGEIEKRSISEGKSSMLRVDENMVDGNVVWLRIYSSSLACCGIAVEEKKGEGGGGRYSTSMHTPSPRQQPKTASFSPS